MASNFWWHPRCFLVVFPLLGLGNLAVAQQRPTPINTRIQLSPEDQSRGHNGSQANFFFATGQSTDYQSAGFFGQKIRPYLADNPEALDYLNSYRRQKSLLLVERAVFVGSVALYGQQILARDEKQYFNSTQQVAIGIAVFSLLSNIVITRNTNTNMQRAVETHNSMLHRHSWQWRPTQVGLATTALGKPTLALRWQLH